MWQPSGYDVDDDEKVKEGDDKVDNVDEENVVDAHAELDGQSDVYGNDDHGNSYNASIVDKTFHHDNDFDHFL